MSNTKSVEQQLKEAIEASKQTLALSEQVTSLASEKEALSKRLAEIETALSTPKASEPVAVDPLVIEKLGQLLAERELTAKTIKELQANVVRLEKEAAKKADLNEYVQQRMEEGKDGNTPAEQQHLDAGKKDDEACGPEYKKGKKAKKANVEVEEDEDEDSEMPAAKKAKKGEMPEFIKEKIEQREEEESEEGEPMKSKKGKKAAKAEWDDEEDYSDLSEEEIDMIRQHRYGKKHGKKADSTLKAPLEEQEKDFGDIIPQPGLDPEKNNVNEDNTTSPTMAKKAKKASMKKGETDVEEIMESPDLQKEEGEDHEHEVTLSEPEKGAKKGKKAEGAALEPKAKKAEDSGIPAPLMDYIKQLIEQEKKDKETAKKGENVLPGVNKQDVTGQPDQDEEESILEKKDAKKGKKAETLEKCVKDNCASDVTKVHEDGCAPTNGNTTEVGDTQPLAADEAIVPVAKQSLDSVVDVAVERLAQVAKAKAEAEALLAKKDEALAAEVKAKTEAMSAVAQLQAKFEAMLSKLAQTEAADKSLEAKAAKIVAASAADPVAAEIQSDDPVTDEDILAKFESITDSREKNRYFKAHAAQISRAANKVLRRRS